MSSDQSIVFFGSGPVAAQSLELLAQNFSIEAVITKPQPVHHREAFPVLVAAEKLGLKVFTPSGKQALSELFKTKPVNSHLGVVIDYGFIINQDVIDYFPLGIINSHFSLLPEWRGADPISFAILSGQKHTGVSLMRIVEKMDEGPILAFGIKPLTGEETTPSLTEDLIQLSNALLRDNLPRYYKGEQGVVSQDEVVKTLEQHTEPIHVEATYSRKLTKEDGVLDFTKPADQLEREIRAFIEWPKSRTTLAGKDVVITKAHSVPSDGTPGKVEIVDKKMLLIYCGTGYLCVERLKPAGKQEMSATAFIAGYGQNLTTG